MIVKRSARPQPVGDRAEGDVDRLGEERQVELAALLAQLEDPVPKAVPVTAALPTAADAARMVHEEGQDLAAQRRRPAGIGGGRRRRRPPRWAQDAGKQTEDIVAHLVGTAARGAGGLEDAPDVRMLETELLKPGASGKKKAGDRQRGDSRLGIGYDLQRGPPSAW